MLRIELRHLMALQTVAAEGSFQRAARKLDYTQSAVSQQIIALERILGRKLVNRPQGGQPLTLTDAGSLVLKYASTVQGALSTAQAELAALDQGALGALRIGTFQSVSARVLPEILSEFRRSRSSVELLVSEGPSDNALLPLLEREELDVSFVELPVPSNALSYRQLLIDEYLLVVPAASPLARTPASLTLQAIADLALIGFKQGRSAERVIAHFRSRGLDPEFALRVDDNNMIQAAVASGLGVALMPRLAIDPDRSELKALTLAEELPPRLIAIAWPAHRPAAVAAEAFVETAAKAFERFGRDARASADSRELPAARVL